MHIIVTDSFNTVIACISVDELENDTDILMRGVKVHRVFGEPLFTNVDGKIKFQISQQL